MRTPRPFACYAVGCSRGVEHRGQICARCWRHISVELKLVIAWHQDEVSRDPEGDLMPFLQWSWQYLHDLAAVEAWENRADAPRDYWTQGDLVDARARLDVGNREAEG